MKVCGVARLFAGRSLSVVYAFHFESEADEHGVETDEGEEQWPKEGGCGVGGRCENGSEYDVDEETNP